MNTTTEITKIRTAADVLETIFPATPVMQKLFAIIEAACAALEGGVGKSDQSDQSDLSDLSDPPAPPKAKRGRPSRQAAPEAPAEDAAESQAKPKSSYSGLQSLLDRTGCTTIAGALACFDEYLSPGEIATMLGVPRLSVEYALAGNVQDAVCEKFRAIFTIKGE